MDTPAPGPDGMPAIRQILNIQMPALRIHTHVRILMAQAVYADPAVIAERGVLLGALARASSNAVVAQTRASLQKLAEGRDEVLRDLMQTVGSWCDRMDRPGDRMDDGEVRAFGQYLLGAVKAAAKHDNSFVVWFMWLDLALSGIVPEDPPAALPNGVPGIIKFPRKGDDQPGVN